MKCRIRHSAVAATAAAAEDEKRRLYEAQQLIDLVRMGEESSLDLECMTCGSH